MRVGIFIFVFCSLVFSSAGNDDLIHLRDLYYKASVNRKDAEVFSEAVAATSSIKSSLASGYAGMAWMIKANHAYNPYNKLSYFLKGKALLDDAITADPKEVELRFLRFCVQTNAPAFLGYSGKIAEDKKVIVLGFHALKDNDLRKRIREFMVSSKSCNEQEKAMFRISGGQS